MKILINVRDIHQAGGISNYYRILQPYLSDSADYFTNSYNPESSNNMGGLSFLKLFYFFYDLVRFFFLLLFHHRRYNIVVLNPTFAPMSVWRDQAYCVIAKFLFGKKVYIFWRGWRLSYVEKLEKKAKRIFKFILFKTDGMFVLASPFRDTLLRWGYKGPIKMMTTTTEDSFLDYPRTYDAQKKCYNVLYLSRITKLKGIFPALETVRILQQEMKLNFRFTIAGYGDCVDEVLKKIEELHLQNVDFKGYVAGEKKIETFQEADIFFFPSFIEGMPNVVLEAMALGLPIITTRVGGLPDFFKNNEMGFMVDSVSPQDFANRIAELLNNPSLLETFGKYNREYARNHFRASLVAEKLKGYLV